MRIIEKFDYNDDGIINIEDLENIIIKKYINLIIKKK